MQIKYVIGGNYDVSSGYCIVYLIDIFTQIYAGVQFMTLCVNLKIMQNNMKNKIKWNKQTKSYKNIVNGVKYVYRMYVECVEWC